MLFPELLCIFQLEELQLLQMIVMLALAIYTTWLPLLCRDEIERKLDIGSWVFLIVVIADFVGLFLAMLMRNMSDSHHQYR